MLAGSIGYVSRYALFIGTLLLSTGFAAQHVYVSPDGDDNAAGTKQAPLKTLHAARDKVREINDGTEDIVVYLRGNVDGGYHFLDSTLTLDQRDGGKNGKTVTYAACPDDREMPVVSGGIRIGNWTLHDQAKNIWKASPPVPVNKKIRNLTVDHFPAVRALGQRFVQGEAWGEYADGTEGFFVGNEKGLWEEKGPFSVDLHNPRDVELYKQDTWLSQQWCVEEQLTTGEHAKIKMQQPMWRVAQYKAGTHGEGAELLFENDLSFLDFENEFYYDRPNQTLYYIPREGVDLNTAVVIAPRVERLVAIQGASPSERIENVALRGIAFHDDSYLLSKVEDSYGYIGVQSITAFVRPVEGENWKNDEVEYWMGQMQIQSAIEALFADGITIRGCRFEYLGGGGVNFMNDVHNSTIDRCIFRWTGSHAINVGHDEHCDPTNCYDQPLYPFPPDPAYIRTCTNITISNNITRNVSWQFTHAPTIMVYFVDGLDLLHNDLGPCGFNNVSLGWGWSRCDQTNEHRNNYAAHNVIWTGCRHHGDCGTFYTLGDQRGFVAEENFFPGEWEPTMLTASRFSMKYRQQAEPDMWMYHHLTNRISQGFYPDAGTVNVTYKNTVYEGYYKIASSWTGKDRNIVVDGGWRPSDSKESDCDNLFTCKNVTTYERGNRPPEAQAVVDRAGPEDKSLYDALDWVPGEPSPVPARQPKYGTARSGKLETSIIAGARPSVVLRTPARRHVTVTLHDAAGRLCLSLLDGWIDKGAHRFALAPRTAATERRGWYVVRIRTANGVISTPIVVTR